jgi:hypothetical protein
LGKRGGYQTALNDTNGTNKIQERNNLSRGSNMTTKYLAIVVVVMVGVIGRVPWGNGAPF